MKAQITDPDFQLYVGGALEVLRELPDESVQCVVTSPPYWGLRDYGTASWEGGTDPACDHEPDRTSPRSTLVGTTTTQGQAAIMPSPCTRCGAVRVDDQLGLEQTPHAYVERLVEIFGEVRRVLRRDGVCWLNLGDTYAGGGSSGRNDTARMYATDGPAATGLQPSRTMATPELRSKNLVGIPWRVAFALQADGWILRCDVIWSKPNPMPESIRDRPTKSHEYVFLLTRSQRYFWDQEAIAETSDGVWNSHQAFVAAGPRRKMPTDERLRDLQRTQFAHDTQHPDIDRQTRNVRSVWTIPTQPYPGAHFAVFPADLVRRCVLAATSERGCCPTCGAPWKREVEISRPDDYDPAAVDPKFKQATGGRGNSRPLTKIFADSLGSSRQTIGWTPGCTHDLEPIGCVVLDPFLGSGTTAQVARSLGRRSIGIDLNPDYAPQIAERTQQLSLFAQEAIG